METIDHEGDNIHLTVRSDLAPELSIDQSLAHDGVCLTVTSCSLHHHTVTAIHETIKKTNLGDIQEGDVINLERCMKLEDRLDGHIVQGHIDDIGICQDIIDENGSWRFQISFDRKHAGLVIDKGSITINGVSLTVVDPTETSLDVTIIPYTYDNTSFSQLKKGDHVNLEFDILGKYILRNLTLDRYRN